MGFANKLGTLFGAVTATGSKLRQALDFAAPATLASAATVNLGAAASNRASITGATTITAFDSIPAGAVRTVTFAGSLVLTHNAASLILPGAANITTAAGDVAEFESLGGGNWRCTDFQSAASIGGAAPVDAQTFNASGTWTKPTGGQTMARIQKWGGGGGGSMSTNATQTAGGGGGGYSEITVPISYLAASVAITVGVAGAGATTAANGGNGGNSSVPLANFPGGAKTVTAFGGGGGSPGLGGGGGGQSSAGLTTGYPGGPLLGPLRYWDGAAWIVSANGLQGAGANLTDTAPANSGELHGGGGGAQTLAPGNSLWGGGGGGSNASGTSVHGGAGGQNAAGSVPGGGGGFAASSNINGSNGGAGRVIITSF